MRSNRFGGALALLAAVTIAGLASTAFGRDITPYGDFELDNPGTRLPTGWDNNWGNLDGVEDGDAFSPGSPAGGQKYGAASNWGNKNGGIDIDVPIPEPDWWTKSITIGAWLYTWQRGGSPADNQIRFSLRMQGEPDRFSDWFDNQERWEWREWTVADLSCRDFNVGIEFRQDWQLEWNVAYVDGVQVEHFCIPQLTTLVWDADAANDGDWVLDPANWDPDGPPTADDRAVVQQVGGGGTTGVLTVGTFEGNGGRAVAGNLDVNHATVHVTDTGQLDIGQQVNVAAAAELRVDGLLTAADLAIAPGGTLSGSGTIDAVVSAEGTVAPGSGNGNGNGVLTFQVELLLGADAVYRCQLGQWDSDNVPDPWNPVPPAGPVNDMIYATTNELPLHGTLQLEPTEKLSPAHELPGQPGVMVEWYGDQTRLITSTGGENSVTFEFAAVPPAQPEVYDLPGTGNWGQGHLGHGAFLTRFSGDGPVIHPGITYDAQATQVHLFQAADGDTNGDRLLDSLDVQAILSANTFPEVQPADWPQGDFTGDGWCNGLDVQAILATGLYPFLPGPYAAVEPGQPLDGVCEVILDPATGELVIDPHGLVINGYVIRSEAGSFTGGPADNLGWFVEDTDRQISGNMGFTLTGPHVLGNVIGPEVIGPEWQVVFKQPLDAYQDLTFTYTVAGRPGTFMGNLIIVPEPSTLAMLLGTGTLGLLWAALRRRKA